MRERERETLRTLSFLHDVNQDHIFFVLCLPPLHHVHQCDDLATLSCLCLLYLSSGVLCPRCETEGLVDRAVSKLSSLSVTAPLRVLDVGAGTGAVGLAILQQCQNVRCDAIDINPSAVALARRNASMLNLSDRYTCEDIGVAEYARLHARTGAPPFDVLVSNPPYIPDAAAPTLEPEVMLYEPRTALFGGSDGLSVSGACTCPSRG